MAIHRSILTKKRVKTKRTKDIFNKKNIKRKKIKTPSQKTMLKSPSMQCDDGPSALVIDQASVKRSLVKLKDREGK